MHIWQAIKMASKSLWTNKLRSFLTMLGIIIGVMTVSLLTTVAQGVSNAVVSSIREQSTLAVLMNMTQRMTYSEANSIIKTVQPTDTNAEDYFDYALALNSNTATTYQSLDGVGENFEDYLLYEKLYNFSQEELDEMTSQERVVAETLMLKKKRAPTGTSIMAVPANFTTVYNLDIDGNFPKTSSEVLVDREFVEYYFKNEDYLGAIGKTISFGVTYKTEIKIKISDTTYQNEAFYQNLINFLTGKLDTGKDDENGENIYTGIGLKIIKTADDKDYVFDEATQTLTIDTEFFEYLKNEEKDVDPTTDTSSENSENPALNIKSVEGAIMMFAQMFTGVVPGSSKLTLTEDDVSVTDIYSNEKAKTFTICGVLTDDNDSLFVGTANIGETNKKDDGEDKMNLTTLMSAAFSTTKGTAYVLQSDETLASIGIKADKVSDATIFYAYFRYKTEDVVEDSVSKISIAFLQSHYMIMSEFMMISMSSVASIISRVMNILTIMLTVISVISLVVGGIGIMNIMLVAVTERTREIGIRKAIGAKKSSILVQFLIEALMLSIIGGAIGLIISAIGSAIIGSVMGVSMAMPAWVIAMSIGFCTAIGLIFGMFPAVKASNMQPIDALRRE